MIKSTDRQVVPNVYMALSCIYNPKYNPEKALTVAGLVHQAMPVLYKILNVKPGVKVRVGPIKSKTMNGRYYSHARTIDIDHRMPLDKIMQTLAHEMVHAEQYDQGRLAWNGRVQFWHGTAHHSKATTYNAYRALPWEAEAFDRQAGLADQVWAELGWKPE